MTTLIDLAGRRFNRLTIIRRSSKPNFGSHSRWLAKCDCGQEVEVFGNNVKSGHTKSCGCLQSENRIRHGGAYLPEYETWQSVRTRCNGKTGLRLKYYNSKGIKVCERWDSFEYFLADMGNRPSPDHSIDRIDADGNYEPGNCRWATRAEQANNTTRNRNVTFRGITKTLSQWACGDTKLRSRMSRRLNSGKPPEQVLRDCPMADTARLQSTELKHA